MMPKVSLRLKLSDFINTDIEQEVMERINNIHSELHTKLHSPTSYDHMIIDQ